MSVEVQVTNIVNEILKVESIEEAFSCFLVQRPELATEKLNTFLQELQVAFSGNPSEQENAVKQYLSLAVSMSNPSRLHILFTLLENLVSNNTLPARLVCDCILSCDKLVYQNECFWCESFTLIKRILPGVNYKGVREIMKSCWEKLQTLPVNLNAAVVNQTKVAESVIECIFDRHNCLLPAYFIITELQKAYPDGKKWPHWSSDYTETDVPSTSFDEKLPTDVLTSPITSEPPKKKKRTADKLINSTRQSSELPNTSDDEFQLFANSIAAQLRTLPLSKAVYLQAEIQSRISNERIKFLLSQESNVTAHQSLNICQKKSKYLSMGADVET